MNLDRMNSIDKTHMVLDAISKKQEVMASNVTNANTPGYVRKDVSFNAGSLAVSYDRK